MMKHRFSGIRRSRILSILLVIGVLLTSFPAIDQMKPLIPDVKAQEVGPSTVAEIWGEPIIFVEESDYISLNFSMFRVEFYKGSAGYNVLYDRNGSVLVYNERQVLQYWSGSQWKQRGVPYDLTWVQVDDYQYNVTRHYTDYIGTLYNVTFVVRSDVELKSVISINAGQTDDYRLLWEMSGIVHEPYSESETRLVFGEIVTGWVAFDWGDVYKTLGNITETSVETVAQGKKMSAYFNVGVIETGQTLVIDPSTVGTSTSSYATTDHGAMRKTFFANTRHWVFYSDGTNMVWKSSTDGSSWDGPTTVRGDTSSGSKFSVSSDGTYVHYAQTPQSFGGALSYRRGLLNSDGSITWSAAEQEVYQQSDRVIYYPTIATDSDGYPFIGYRHYYSQQIPYVTKSSANDGTWSTDSGFPYQLSSTDDVWSIQVVPLTSTRMYVVYTHDPGEGYPFGKLWDGDSWSGQETIASLYQEKGIYASATSEGDHVHFVFLEDVSYDIHYVKRSYGSGWGSVETVYSGANSKSGPVITMDDSTGDQVVFWAGDPSSNHIYYKRRSSGTWDGSQTDWINEGGDGLKENDRLQSFLKDNDGGIGLIYMTKSGSPTTFAITVWALMLLLLLQRLTVPLQVPVRTPLRV